MNWLLTQTGLNILSGVSLLIFTGFFAGMLVWTLRLNGSYVKDMAWLPLQEYSADKNVKENANEA